MTPGPANACAHVSAIDTLYRSVGRALRAEIAIASATRVNAPQGRYVRDKRSRRGDRRSAHQSRHPHDAAHARMGQLLQQPRLRTQRRAVWLIGWGASTYDAETVYAPLFRSGKI